jgi:glutamate-ammonia-ligase adenylyltransferase
VALLAAGRTDQAREEIVDRVSAAARQHRDGDRRLWPVTIDLDNDSAPAATRLSIQSVDTLGFLFEFSNALAMLEINIQQVKIRTRGDEVDDTFWVTDARGEKITDPRRLDQLRLAAVLIKQFAHLLPSAPNPSQALRQFSALTMQLLSHPEWVQDVQSLRSGKVLQTVAELMGASQFLWEDFLRMQHENLFPVLRNQPGLEHQKSKENLQFELQDECKGREEAQEAAECLNLFKDREMFRIDLRHITRRIDFVQFSRELSDLADVVVDRAARLAEQSVVGQLGTPRDTQGNACAWCVCGLGKFGGRELGFASDIELVFVYRGGRKTDGNRPVDVSVFFEEWVSAFLRSLAARQEGIFQVDLRLRPYGKSGSLASTIDSFQKYFSPSGAAEQFERMALVKLRPVGGDPELADQLIELRDRFVYSGEPLDLENIRHLRHRQVTELVPRGATSAKHSPGGLVDIEYFVQAQQILAGAQHPSVRVPNTLEAISQLRRVGWLDLRCAQQCAATYGFLRRLIDALRVVRGHARDLTLPAGDSREFDYLSRRLDYATPADLESDLKQHRTFASRLWEEASRAEAAGG